MSISAVKNSNNIVIAASEQKSSPSQVSLFNVKGVKEAQASETENLETFNAANDTKSNYKQYIKDAAENFNAPEEKVILLLDKLGYTEEVISKMSKEDFFDLIPHFDSLIEYIYTNDGDTEKKFDSITKLANYTNGDLEALQEYAENFGNCNFLKFLQAAIKDEHFSIKDDIKKQILNAKTSDDIPAETLSRVLLAIIRQKDYLKTTDNMKIENVISYIFFNMPEADIKSNGRLCIKLYNELKDKENISQNSVILTAMFDKLKDSDEALEAFLEEDAVEDIFSAQNNPKAAEMFLFKAQEIIDSGSCEQKAILANKVAGYMSSQFILVNRLKSKPENELSREEHRILKDYEQLEEIYKVAAGYSYTYADMKHARELHNNATSTFNTDAYTYTYKFSLKDRKLNPINITAKLDEISSNEYSKVLTELGYELPNTENLYTLREKAEKGEFDNTVTVFDINSSSEAEFGYTHIAQSEADLAAEKANTLLTAIILNSDNQENKLIIERVQNPDNYTYSEIQEPQTIETTNLGQYDSKTLAKFLAKSIINISDLAHQYSKKLKDSGKDLFINKIKSMNASYAENYINKVGNDSDKLDIMKQTNNEDLDIHLCSYNRNEVA